MILKYNEMYKEVLSILSNGEELKYSEMVDKVACILDLSQARLVETVKRGIYKITNEGKNVFKSEL